MRIVALILIITLIGIASARPVPIHARLDSVSIDVNYNMPEIWRLSKNNPNELTDAIHITTNGAGKVYLFMTNDGRLGNLKNKVFFHADDDPVSQNDDNTPTFFYDTTGGSTDVSISLEIDPDDVPGDYTGSVTFTIEGE